MRVQRKVTAAGLGLLGALAVFHGAYQGAFDGAAGSGDGRHVADPPLPVEEVLEDILDRLPDDMHW
ncbi:hypothetical protein [Actinophytocola gossypii]|uniref:Uncharacterized protein n=1 Tax=Actinophytocola gossypii TaxID=2812003 RepID=A0ABT2JK54_9PSEU|nr:hypothetical protein [Actinophytocola gossypii]MCT2587649.1 hypothetical protein [Actinophytocola gossypii]